MSSLLSKKCLFFPPSLISPSSPCDSFRLSLSRAFFFLVFPFSLPLCSFRCWPRYHFFTIPWLLLVGCAILFRSRSGFVAKCIVSVTSPPNPFTAPFRSCWLLLACFHCDSGTGSGASFPWFKIPFFFFFCVFPLLIRKRAPERLVAFSSSFSYISPLLVLVGIVTLFPFWHKRPPPVVLS